MGGWTGRVTLKAFANFSPGFALKPWVQKCGRKLFATLKELRRFAVGERRRNPFRVASSTYWIGVTQGCEAQPWAEISERFQRCCLRELPTIIRQNVVSVAGLRTQSQT